MAELFQRDRSVISKHIKNVFEDGELSLASNVQNLHIANSDKPVDFYSLDVVISVGYRVKSQRGVQFRIWATGILKEYIKKDFMGLMTFSGEQPTFHEAKVAKNYLDEKELRSMGQLVFGYLDFAERQAEREAPMTMEDWAKHFDGILTSTGENLLTGNGTVSHLQAIEKVISMRKVEHFNK